MDLSSKELVRRWIIPILVLGIKLGLGQMAKNRCHDYIAVAPLSTEVEIETVVLDISVSCVALDDSVDILWLRDVRLLLELGHQKDGLQRLLQ